MKPRTLSILAGIVACAWMLTPPQTGSAAPGDGATPAPASKGEARKKKDRDGATAKTPPAAVKGGGSIQIPLPQGKPGLNVRVPDTDAAGKLLSLLMAQKATRLDDDRVKLEGMHMDFNQPDGKQDFHVAMPASILNLKTHFITSDDPVTISTQEFALTGEKMEFNTLEREGRLIGSVRMVIHNLKQLAAPKDTAEKSE